MVELKELLKQLERHLERSIDHLDRVANSFEKLSGSQEESINEVKRELEEFTNATLYHFKTIEKKLSELGCNKGNDSLQFYKPFKHD